MNWEVHKVVKLTSRMVDEADEVCEHLKVGDTCHCIGEQDSFGPVSRLWHRTSPEGYAPVALV